MSARPHAAEAAGARAGREIAGCCAAALAAHVADSSAPIAEIGCGTGLGGLALAGAGFTCIDGFDEDAAALERAAARDVYRELHRIDRARPLQAIADGDYRNVTAIDLLEPGRVPPTLLDDVVALLPAGGCVVLSLTDEAARRGFRGRLLELCDYAVADPVFRERIESAGPGLPTTLHVLKKR